MPARFDLEARLADEEAVIDVVASGSEVRLERKLVVVDDVIARLPEIERVLSAERLVVAVEPSVEAVDVNESFPLARHRREHLVIKAKVVFTRRHDRVDTVAGTVGDVPTEREKLVLEVGLDAVADVRLLVEHERLVGTLVRFAGEKLVRG